MASNAISKKKRCVKAVDREAQKMRDKESEVDRKVKRVCMGMGVRAQYQERKLGRDIGDDNGHPAHP